jgi:hypothetical protein
VATDRAARGAILSHAAHEPVALVRGKPPRVFRSIRQDDQHDQAKHQRRQPFDEEEPLPAAHAGISVPFRGTAGGMA